MTEIRLPTAGDAVRLRAPDGEPETDQTMVAFVFDASDHHAWLWCHSTAAGPPDDLWLSNTDTIEFLPDKE